MTDDLKKLRELAHELRYADQLIDRGEYAQAKSVAWRAQEAFTSLLDRLERAESLLVASQRDRAMKEKTE